ncbi:MAG: hypothetical protein EHM47_00905 [Ignavibacteriales bacterium]|nr:MAG: hypothetical protein EHM47_00905 [Ignavibacteriales bacterium]
MSWLKEKYEETKEGFKKDWEEKSKANAETRKQTRAAYFAERQRQQVELARKKAIFEREAEERKLRLKFAPKKPTPLATGLSSGFGFENTPTKTSNPNSFKMSWEPTGINSSSYFKPKKKKGKKKKEENYLQW